MLLKLGAPYLKVLQEETVGEIVVPKRSSDPAENIVAVTNADGRVWTLNNMGVKRPLSASPTKLPASTKGNFSADEQELVLVLKGLPSKPTLTKMNQREVIGDTYVAHKLIADALLAVFNGGARAEESGSEDAFTVSSEAPGPECQPRRLIRGRNLSLASSYKATLCACHVHRRP